MNTVLQCLKYKNALEMFSDYNMAIVTFFFFFDPRRKRDTFKRQGIGVILSNKSYINK